MAEEYYEIKEAYIDESRKEIVTSFVFKDQMSLSEVLYFRIVDKNGMVVYTKDISIPPHYPGFTYRVIVPLDAIFGTPYRLVTLYRGRMKSVELTTQKREEEKKPNWWIVVPLIAVPAMLGIAIAAAQKR